MNFKKRIKENIERKNLSIIDMIANLPANGPLRMKQPDGFSNGCRLLFQIYVLGPTGLVCFPNIIRRRAYDKMH